MTIELIWMKNNISRLYLLIRMMPNYNKLFSLSFPCLDHVSSFTFLCTFAAAKKSIIGDNKIICSLRTSARPVRFYHSLRLSSLTHLIRPRYKLNGFYLGTKWVLMFFKHIKDQIGIYHILNYSSSNCLLK